MTQEQQEKGIAWFLRVDEETWYRVGKSVPGRAGLIVGSIDEGEEDGIPYYYVKDENGDLISKVNGLLNPEVLRRECAG